MSARHDFGAKRATTTVRACGNAVAGLTGMTKHTSASGFTLLETLIATGMLITAFAGLAHLFALSVRFTRDSGQFGAALVAAQDKLESLRSLRFGYDADGNPVTDSRLSVSPTTSLDEDIASWCDRLDDQGNVVVDPPASFVRRWRVRQAAADDPAAIVIDVCVFDASASNVSAAQAEACLGTARVRQP